MLKAARESLELEHSVKLMDDAFGAALASSCEYQKRRALPGWALELLDRACTAARLTSSASEQPEADIDITAERVEHVLPGKSRGK
jgi:ATP-dependent Clp protease ATP-binding subunit ClpA